MARATDWMVRHSTALIMGAGVLLLVDSRLTNVLVEAPDGKFDYALEENTIEGWRRYVEDGGSPEKASAELARHHDAARTHLGQAGASHPEGLDPLLSALRERVDFRVYLQAEDMKVDEGSFASIELPDHPDVRVVPIAEHLDHRDWSCARGMSAAFEAAMGSKVIEVQTPDAFDADPAPDAPRIHLEWTASANGSLYGHGGKRLFPGFVVQASMRLSVGDIDLASVSAAVDPPSTVEYTTYGPAPMLFDADHEDIASGMIEGACRRLGERLIGELTGWTPPSEPEGEGEDLEDKCKGGDATACLTVGEQLRSSNPERALEMLEQGCNPFNLGGGECCMAAAEIALQHPDDPISPTAKAAVLLDRGCDGNHGPACARAAELKLTRGDAPPSDWAQVEAYVQRLRACDLRFAPACAAAAQQAESGSGQLESTASPLRAAILFARACGAGDGPSCARADVLRESAASERTLHGTALEFGDEVFDVRWGMWVESGATEITWVATAAEKVEVERRLSTEIAQGRARVYDPASLPLGPRPPVEARTIYALAREPQMVWKEARACPECTAERYRPGTWNPMPSCACLPH